MSNSSNTEELGIRLNADGVAEFVLGVGQGGKAVEDFGRKADGAGQPLGNTTQLLRNSGKTARETAQAWRLLPAQITDVVTSLASGQPAWLVAIQQGGQIKDSFGGVGPMFRELAAAVGPVRLGLMGLAGAGAVVLLAHQQGQREAQAFGRSLIMTGNAAGAYTGQMTDMAKAVSQVVGSQGQASAALALLAGNGEVAAANLQRVAEVAVRMERDLGQPLEETARRFQELGRDPLEASQRLNRGVNYLTASVYEQIRALMAQGKVLEAGAVAQGAYAEAMSTRTQKVSEQLGYLQRGTRAVADGAKWMWDRLLDIGRDDTLDQKLAAAQRRLEALQQTKARNPVQLKGPDFAGGIDGQIQAQADLVAGLQQQRDQASGKAAKEAEDAAARQEALRSEERGLVEAGNTIALAQARAAASQREALILRELSVAAASATSRESLARRETASLEDLRDRDFVSATDYFDRKAQLERRSLGSQMQVLESQISAEARLAKSRAAALDAELAAEQRRKPENLQESMQQQARLTELQAQRSALGVDQETRRIELLAQRSALVAQQAASEVSATRAVAAAAGAAEDQFLSAINLRRQSLAQFGEQLRVSNAAATVDLIADPYKRAAARARLEVDELNRYYIEQVAGLRQRHAALEVVDPDAAVAVAKEIEETEQRKAQAVLLINRRLVEDLKPEWQRMLEGWQDTTRLMRESYDAFQTGWLRTGEDAWVQYSKTGKLNISSLTDFAVGEFAKLAFRSVLAKPMEQAGNFLANLVGLPGGNGDGAVATASKTAAMTAEMTARTALTTNMGLAVIPLNAMASAASNAAVMLAMMSASGSGSSGGNLLASLVSIGLGGSGTGGEVAGGVNGSAGTAVIPGNVAHTGAIMGAGEGWTRTMPASTWAAARRYHSGGLAHDEVPAILQRGEGVYTEGQMKKMAPVDAMAKALAGARSPSVTQHVSISIDARTDQAQVAELTRSAMGAAKAALLEEMARGQV